MAFEIWNRRHTGSKYKLSDWIVGLINENCNGTSFCDLFAGTGIISELGRLASRNTKTDDMLLKFIDALVPIHSRLI